MTQVRAILELRNAQETLRIEKEGSDFEQKWLAEHPGMAASLKALHEAQDTMYRNDALASAVYALREAEKENAIEGH